MTALFSALVLASSLSGAARQSGPPEPKVLELPGSPGTSVRVSLEGGPLTAGSPVEIAAELLQQGAEPPKARVSYRIVEKESSPAPWEALREVGPGAFEAEARLKAGRAVVQFQVQLAGAGSAHEFAAWTIVVEKPPLDNRQGLIVLMLLLPSVALVNSVVSAVRLKRLVGRIPRITGRLHMDAFKKEVKLQMYLAVVQWPLLSIPSALFFIDLWFLEGPLSDLVYAIGPSLVILVVARVLKRVEDAAMNIPAQGDQLEQERQRVVSTWKGGAVPDW